MWQHGWRGVNIIQYRVDESPATKTAYSQQLTVSLSVVDGKDAGPFHVDAFVTEYAEAIGVEQVVASSAAPQPCNDLTLRCSEHTDSRGRV